MMTWRKGMKGVRIVSGMWITKGHWATIFYDGLKWYVCNEKVTHDPYSGPLGKLAKL